MEILVIIELNFEEFFEALSTNAITIATLNIADNNIMGLKHSSCYSSNCLDNEYTGGDEQKQYSNIRHHNITNITTPSSSNNSSYKVDKDIEEIDQTFDEMIQQTSLQIDSNYDNINSHDTYLMEHNNNDSDSNESVLTAISPTKERHLR